MVFLNRTINICAQYNEKENISHVCVWDYAKTTSNTGKQEVKSISQIFALMERADNGYDLISLLQLFYFIIMCCIGAQIANYRRKHVIFLLSNARAFVEYVGCKTIFRRQFIAMYLKYVFSSSQMKFITSTIHRHYNLLQGLNKKTFIIKKYKFIIGLAINCDAFFCDEFIGDESAKNPA